MKEVLSLQVRIQVLVKLGTILDPGKEELKKVIYKAHIHNPWFVPENIHKALHDIIDNYLNIDALEDFVGAYKFDKTVTPKNIGLVMAGNIPLVGIHDVICCFLAGHRSVIKLSDKDKELLPYLIQVLSQIEPQAKDYFYFAEKLTSYDAVIATGSNNSAMYFEYYFRNVPHIIRKNRNGIAVLTGDESSEDLYLLGKDIFDYFGLGCRNVSKIMVPKGYVFDQMMEQLDNYNPIILHNKYKNNFDYNYAIYLLNKEKFFMNDCLIVRKNQDIASRIASVHYQEYDDLDALQLYLLEKREEIQCITSKESIPSFHTIPFGTSQSPKLTQFADDVNTMDFLINL